MLETFLRAAGHMPWRASNGADAFACLNEHEIDVALVDVFMPDTCGLNLCREIAEHHAGVPVIVVTGRSTIDVAIAALRAGAYDFVAKPLTVPELSVSLKRALQQGILLRTPKDSRASLPPTGNALLGESPGIAAVNQLLVRVADGEDPVLISGASGTGKEVAARAIHSRSRRADRPFVSIDCADVSKSPFLREVVARAYRGTLFLDDVAECPLTVQAELLRVVQRRGAEPAVSHLDDVRIVAATSDNLESVVAEGAFLGELHRRISVVEVHLPPLRARGCDPLLIAEYFLKRFAAEHNKDIRGISWAAGRALLDYHWPGNVREVESCIHRAVGIAQHDELLSADLPAHMQLPLDPLEPRDLSAKLLPLHAIERQHVLRVLAAVEGNKSCAARILGIDRKTLYRKL